MADIFNINRGGTRSGVEDDATGGGGGGGGDNKIGVFITEQSLATFPIASGIVTALWNLAGAVVQGWGRNKTVPIVIALIIGALIYLMSADKGQTASQKIVRFVIALINSLMLAATALGIGNAVGSNPTTPGAP
ncbi:MAG TPA: hypothetical protein VGB73_13865 [Pyrinomonadaceae bacterium]